MRKITKDNDLIIIPVITDCNGTEIPMDKFQGVSYEFYTDGVYKYTAQIQEGKIYIPSNIVSQFASGILKYTLHFSVADTHFSDGKFDTYLHNYITQIYLV